MATSGGDFCRGLDANSTVPLGAGGSYSQQQQTKGRVYQKSNSQQAGGHYRAQANGRAISMQTLHSNSRTTIQLVEPAVGCDGPRAGGTGGGSRPGRRASGGPVSSARRASVGPPSLGCGSMATTTTTIDEETMVTGAQSRVSLDKSNSNFLVSMLCDDSRDANQRDANASVIKERARPAPARRAAKGRKKVRRRTAKSAGNDTPEAGNKWRPNGRGAGAKPINNMAGQQSSSSGSVRSPGKMGADRNRRQQGQQVAENGNSANTTRDTTKSTDITAISLTNGTAATSFAQNCAVGDCLPSGRRPASRGHSSSSNNNRQMRPTQRHQQQHDDNHLAGTDCDETDGLDNEEQDHENGEQRRADEMDGQGDNDSDGAGDRDDEGDEYDSAGEEQEQEDNDDDDDGGVDDELEDEDEDLLFDPAHDSPAPARHIELAGVSCLAGSVHQSIVSAGPPGDLKRGPPPVSSSWPVTGADKTAPSRAGAPNSYHQQQMSAGTDNSNGGSITSGVYYVNDKKHLGSPPTVLEFVGAVNSTGPNLAGRRASGDNIGELDDRRQQLSGDTVTQASGRQTTLTSGPQCQAKRATNATGRPPRAATLRGGGQR